MWNQQHSTCWNRYKLHTPIHNGKQIDIYLDAFFFLTTLAFGIATALALPVLPFGLLLEERGCVSSSPSFCSSSSASSSSSFATFFRFFFDLALRFRGSGFFSELALAPALAFAAGLMVLQQCNVLEEEWDGARRAQFQSLPGRSGCWHTCHAVCIGHRSCSEGLLHSYTNHQFKCSFRDHVRTSSWKNKSISRMHAWYFAKSQWAKPVRDGTGKVDLILQKLFVQILILHNCIPHLLGHP